MESSRSSAVSRPYYRTTRFWEEATFWLLLLVHLVPVWASHYFLTADGPAHLYNAALLKAMLVEPASSAHQLLALNLNPEPNYLSHLLLAGLLTVLPPWLAEKVILTACVAGLPLALRYIIKGKSASGRLAGGTGFSVHLQRLIFMGVL